MTDTIDGLLECSKTFLITLIIAGLMLVKYFRTKTTRYPIFEFPSDKRENFHIITKDRFTN